MGYFFVCILYVLFVSEQHVIHFVNALPKGLRPCEDSLFPCNNGKCVEQDRWCDLEDDCGDSTDEIYCHTLNSTNNETFTCPPHFFQCNDGPCIPDVGRCNGFKSCDDRSDELNCNDTSFVTLNSTQKPLPARLEYRELESTMPTILQKPDSDLPNNAIRKIVSRSTPNATYGGFSELHTDYYYHQQEMALNFLKSQRKEDFGWGDDTPRALVAYLLSSVPSNYEMTDEHMLMAKQLDLKLSIALARNETKPIKLTDLALYINAILSTCRNPKNFYGYDLVNMLRHRVNAEQKATPRGHFVSPSVYITLCINNATTNNDVKKLKDLSSTRTSHTDRIGIQALALLATSCIVKFSKYADHQLQNSLIQKLLYKIKSEGLPKNVYEISLLIQALNEARVNELEWHRPEAINFLLKRQTFSGSFGDVLATYYVLPILSGRSVLTLDEHCNHFNESDLMPVEVLKNTRRERIDVQYSLYHGNPVDLTMTMQLHIAHGTNFLDIMRIAQERSHNYRFKLDDRRLQPLVYSIGGVPNDAEKGMFWILHVISNRTRIFSEPERLIPYYDNIKTLIPEEGDELVFWMKPI